MKPQTKIICLSAVLSGVAGPSLLAVVWTILSALDYREPDLWRWIFGGFLQLLFVALLLGGPFAALGGLLGGWWLARRARQVSFRRLQVEAAGMATLVGVGVCFLYLACSISLITWFDSNVRYSQLWLEALGQGLSMIPFIVIGGAGCAWLVTTCLRERLVQMQTRRDT